MNKIISAVIAAALTVSSLVMPASAEAGTTIGSVQLDTATETKLTSALETKFTGSIVNVACIGGSITAGTGAVDSKRDGWAYLIGKKFKEKLPSKNVNFFNFGIDDTESTFALFRTEKQLAACNPDVVFVEFSVNDRYAGNSHDAYMESIVRKLQSLDKKPYIILIFAASQPITNCDGVNKFEAVKNYFNLPAIDMFDYFYNEMLPDQIARYDGDFNNYWDTPETGVDTERNTQLKGKYTSADDFKAKYDDTSAYPGDSRTAKPKRKELYNTKGDLYKDQGEWTDSDDDNWTQEDMVWMSTLLQEDHVHPTTAGHYRYAEKILTDIANEPETYLKLPTVPDTRLVADKNFDKAKLVSAADNAYTQTDSWETSNEDFLNKYGVNTISNPCNILKTTSPDQKFIYYFEGDTIGIAGYRYSQFSNEYGYVKGGQADFTVDGKNCTTSWGTTIYINEQTSHNGLAGLPALAENLGEGWHKLEVTTKSTNDGLFTAAYFAINPSGNTPKVKEIKAGNETLPIKDGAITLPDDAQTISLTFDGYPDKGSANEETINFQSANGEAMEYTGKVKPVKRDVRI